MLMKYAEVLLPEYLLSACLRGCKRHVENETRKKLSKWLNDFYLGFMAELEPFLASRLLF